MIQPVYWFSYKQLDILQYVMYNKWIYKAKWLANFHEELCFRQNVKHIQTTKTTLPMQGLKAGSSFTAVWCVTSRSPRQLNVSSKVKLYNFIYVMAWNINRQSRIGGPHFYNKVVFYIICIYHVTAQCSCQYQGRTNNTFTSILKRYWLRLEWITSLK